MQINLGHLTHVRLDDVFYLRDDFGFYAEALLQQRLKR
jgi:hypothetical protein